MIEILANRYKLIELVGEGSYSLVYKCRDLEKKKTVAVKELKMTGMTEAEKKEAGELFFREIEFLKNLNHPAIPEFYDFTFAGGTYFLIMEWIDGDDLISIIKEKGKISPKKVLKYMEEAADFLIYIQEFDPPVVFKDLKPSNIMITGKGKVKIIDFGTARFFSLAKTTDTHSLGTPGYAPPEAYTTAQTDLSSDVYSYGATFYHALTGEEPAQFNFKFPDPRKFNPRIDEKIVKVIMSCLLPRDERVPNAEALKAMIDKIVNRNRFFFKPKKKTDIGVSNLKHDVKAVFRTIMLWIIICFPLVTITSNYYIQLRNRSHFETCQSNMKNLGTALEMYSTDNAGHYPVPYVVGSDALKRITPDYLPEIPKCPAAGKDTYSKSYMGGF